MKTTIADLAAGTLFKVPQVSHLVFEAKGRSLKAGEVPGLQWDVWGSWYGPSRFTRYFPATQVVEIVVVDEPVAA